MLGNELSKRPRGLVQHALEELPLGRLLDKSHLVLQRLCLTVSVVELFGVVRRCGIVAARHVCAQRARVFERAQRAMSTIVQLAQLLEEGARAGFLCVGGFDHPSDAVVGDGAVMQEVADTARELCLSGLLQLQACRGIDVFACRERSSIRVVAAMRCEYALEILCALSDQVELLGPGVRRVGPLLAELSRDLQLRSPQVRGHIGPHPPDLMFIRESLGAVEEVNGIDISAHPIA